jgi:hypothetical protein
MMIVRTGEKNSMTLSRISSPIAGAPWLGDLKIYSDLKSFLEFEQKQTTAAEKLKNPAGHYRLTCDLQLGKASLASIELASMQYSILRILHSEYFWIQDPHHPFKADFFRRSPFQRETRLWSSYEMVCCRPAP